MNSDPKLFSFKLFTIITMIVVTGIVFTGFIMPVAGIASHTDYPDPVFEAELPTTANWH